MRVRLIRPTVAVALAAVLAGLLLWSGGNWRFALTPRSLSVPVAAVGTDATTAFTIGAATITGLYPGARKNMQVTLSNPYTFAIKVTKLTAVLYSVSTKGCTVSAGNLTVKPYLGPPALPLVVSARRSRTAGVFPLYMPNTVANACQRATFVLRLSGTAVKA